MQAQVIKVHEGLVDVMLRGKRVERLYGRHFDLSRGQMIEVKRQTNNPYIVRVAPAQQEVK